MRNHKLILLLILLICSISCTSRSEGSPLLKKGSTISGKVISILDGDTYDVLINGNKSIRVRMEGIDAPEKGMPYYKVAKKQLSDFCFGKQVTLKITGNDKHGRVLAFTYLKNGTELSHEMIKSGLAWHYIKYNSDTTLSKLEIEARNLKKGLWKDENPMAPWTNRSLHRQGISTKDSFNFKESPK